MEEIYYSEEFGCYILQQENLGNNRYLGIILFLVEDLTENEVINKLIDEINQNHQYTEHYKKILEYIVNNNNK